VTVREVAGQDAAVRLVKNKDMGQTLLPDRAAEPFRALALIDQADRISW
jgi:hypothetical protein